MLTLLIGMALADCDPVLVPLLDSFNVEPRPVLLFEDYRGLTDSFELPIQLVDDQGQTVPLQARRAYCALGTTHTYAFTPVEPLTAGTAYRIDVENYGRTEATPVAVNQTPQSAPTATPSLTPGERRPQPGESASSLDENAFIWHLQDDAPTPYVEYQVADATGQVHVFSAAATTWNWIDIGTSLCTSRWPDLTDDTVLFLRARYLNISGESGPWSDWLPTENAEPDALLPAHDASIDCDNPPPPPSSDVDTDTDSDDAESDSDDNPSVSPGCTSLPAAPTTALVVLGLLGIRRRSQR